MCSKQFSAKDCLGIVAAGLMLAMVGCGGNPASVSGVVTLDGQSLDRGKVSFTPVSGGLKAIGVIQADGSYVLSTNRESGLQIGEYLVTVTALEPSVPDPNGGPPRPGKHITPRHYSNVNKSGLRFSVEKGSNSIDLELSSEELAEDNKRRNARR